ncbi:SPASM domain-containing protein [Anoxybacter fermentans]|uniref:SPASM domain-containing protein n=1 Tax=Anoxybacter fermentans TaxID=1323375 RepID=UPI000F8D0E05
MPDGTVLPSRNFEQKLRKEVILGSITNNSITQIWNSKKSKKLRKIVVEHHSYVYNTC